MNAVFSLALYFSFLPSSVVIVRTSLFTCTLINLQRTTLSAACADACGLAVDPYRVIYARDGEDLIRRLPTARYVQGSTHEFHGEPRCNPAT
jgi:hypothetical protein